MFMKENHLQGLRFVLSRLGSFELSMELR
ncbi:hypothetical protein Goari_004716, partial [Gossypium aridum]|nr:hypothetical protein [Gossypium aridum]